MKKIIYFMIALMAFTFVACSPNTPQGVVKTYLKDIKKGEYEKALTSFDIRDSIKQADIEMVAGALKEGMSSKSGISKFKITKQILSNHKTGGEVTAKVYYGNNTDEELHFKVIKIGEKWKIKAK
jgi:hypothetical protein